MSKKQKQYIVVGLGRFGRAIAETLCEDGAAVLVTSYNVYKDWDNAFTFENDSVF